MELLSSNRSYSGDQRVYRHRSKACSCDMIFALYVPEQAQEKPCPVVYYLSGLTCTHANVMEKGEYRRAAAEHGIIIVCPDTSPRGEDIADEDVYFFGSGAGFYVDATQAPYATHYNMYSYVTDELPRLIADCCNADMTRQSIFGHSMGGHGAIMIALKNPDRYKSVSAFAPICAPSGTKSGSNAFLKYLGTDHRSWRSYDSVALIEDRHKFPEILLDQGTKDEFLDSSMRPQLLEAACKQAGIALKLRMQDDFDHSYYFVSTFMEDHIRWHATRLWL